MFSMETGVWGDVPTWVGAVSTTLALIAAGVVVAIELRRDRRATKASESAEQADLVAAWPSRDQRRVADVILLRNGSTLPIYEVEVQLVGDLTGEVQDLAVPHVLPPGDLEIPYDSGVTQFRQVGDYRLPMLPEGGTTWSVRLDFTDSAGRRWRRSPDGQLERWA